MKSVLMPMPTYEYDPTEVAVPWVEFNKKGYAVDFATPTGENHGADPRMLTGRGLGPWKFLLMADRWARNCYAELNEQSGFRTPLRYSNVQPERYSALILPGGHAPGVKEYLESNELYEIVRHFWQANKPVGAICHGVVVLARTSQKESEGRSVLWQRRSTSLLKSQEKAAWLLTCTWLGNYYRTYPGLYVEDEIKKAMSSPEQFEKGPFPLRRDTENKDLKGFVCVDKNYVSARWPGDARTFAHALLEKVECPN